MLTKLLLSILPWMIYSYDNIALRKSAWQLHPYQNVKFKEYTNASKAVDGLKSNLSFTALQCTYSEDLQNIASWRVDLGAVLGIHHITIYYRTDGVPWGPYHGYTGRFLGFSVYISNTTEKEDGVICFKDEYFTKYTIPAVITLNCTRHGRYVIYYNNRTSSSKPADYSEYAYSELCEFEVYGCPTPAYYGENCSLPCSPSCTNRRCHIETGHCFGCIDGYQGQMCEQPCLNNTYGTGCSENCGHCVDWEECNHVNGVCHNGCEAGYYSDRCKRECPPELYGRNCLQNCSIKCYMSKRCNRRTGECDNGCKEGWQPPLCMEECYDGTFGTNCSGTCGHCLKGQRCYKETGACPNGCDSVYEGIYCTKTCAKTYYGPNCNLTCSTSCVNQACDIRSGKCLTENEQTIEGTSFMPAIGVTIGVLFVIAIVVAFIYKRRNTITICRCIISERPALKSSNSSPENTTHMSKTYMNVDMRELHYNEIDENVYEKIKTELPIENTNVYEQYLADIPLNGIGSVKICMGNHNSPGIKKELAGAERKN